MSSPRRNVLRARRLEGGWSQTALAEATGISRQAYSAIEAGRSVPSTDVALRLARELGATVEELFRLPDEPPPPVRARDPELPRPGGFRAGPRRVRLARVSGEPTAFPLLPGGAHAGVPADGIAEQAADGMLRVRPFPGRRPPPDLVVTGCDPAFGLVRERLRHRWDLEVLWIPGGSRAGLRAVARGAAHVAGIHLVDPLTGEYNAPWIRRFLPGGAARIGFASWEQSLLLAPGNPRGIGTVADLPDARLRIVNREPGSGSRALLELRLREAGVPADAVPGFRETAALAHEEVAAAVGSGVADAGVAIRAVGSARGLDLLPLGWEPYELVIPERLMELPAVGALLRTLRSPELQRQVEALGGYDTSAMGRIG